VEDETGRREDEDAMKGDRMSERRSLAVGTAAMLLIASLGILGTAAPCTTCGTSPPELGARASRATAAEGHYVDVGIEAFHSFGFLGLGVWSPLEPKLVTVRVDPLSAGDAARLDEIRAACGRGDGDPAMCAILSDLRYGLVRSYGITPNLDDAYRVVLTNRTASLLGIVLEIDGLNTNGSAPVVGTAEDKKWILLPGQTVRVSGWQVSVDEALAFRFATPSHSHSPLAERRGAIRVHVYLPSPTSEGLARGTEAAEVIGQPTVRIPFRSATESPSERIDFSYARSEVSLGFLCEETSGAGIRISDVVAGTIAELKGLKAGDVVTYINAVPINSCADLTGFLASKTPGDRVVLKVHREGRAFLLTLELEE
jgi:hypothetical protein